MNWGMVIDLLIEFGYNFATSLMSYTVGTNVLALPKPAAYLVAALVGFIGLANHWRALRKSVALMLVAMPLLGGCALSPSADVIKALAGDPATVCVQVNTIYGTVRVARTNITTGNVACNGDGLAVKSEGAAAGIPITVVPQITVGPPVMAPAK